MREQILGEPLDGATTDTAPSMTLSDPQIEERTADLEIG